MPHRPPLRVGLVGAGRRGAAWAAAVGALPVRFVGVADAVGARAQALAEAHGVPAFTSTPALVAACDVVLVAVPLRDRALVAQAALAEGAHVHIGWPPAAGLEEAGRLVAAAEEAGRELDVARPLPVAPLLGALPAGWAARLATLDLASAPPGSPGLAAGADPLVGCPWPHRLAGALDVCATLARSRDVLRVEAEAERGPARALRAVSFALRFRNGAYAQAAVVEAVATPGPAERLRLFAAGGGLRVEARGWEGPLCVDGYSPPAPAANGAHAGAPPEGVPVASPSASPFEDLPLTDLRFTDLRFEDFELAGPRSPSPPAPPVEGSLPRLPDPATAAARRELSDALRAFSAGRHAPFSILDGLHTMRLTERLMERLR